MPKGARTPQQKKFQAVARKCHAALRAGMLPRKGGFRNCMKSGMGGRSRRKGR